MIVGGGIAMSLPIRAALLGVLICLSAAPVRAQSYPSRPITVVTGYAAGTGGDVLIRFFAERLRPLAGQPIVVENKPGALTNIAAEFVARARPDGYTLFIAAGSSTFAANPHLFKNLPYDPIKDFTPVTTLFTLPFFAAVSPTSPAHSMRELTEIMRAKGTNGSYGYGATFSQAAAELYKKLEHLQTIGVAYKAAPTSVTDLLAGQIDFMFVDPTLGLQQASQGQLRLLAVTTAERTPAAPDVPGMRESGLAGFDLDGWFGAWLPAHAPPEIVSTLEAWLNRIVAAEDTRQFLLKAGCAPFPGNAKVVADLVPRDLEAWRVLIRDAHIEPQ
jgi:tripartite-type tricarboxylate transporter receptor subunit TctC